MNIHIPLNIQEKFQNLEFRGKPWKKSGFTWIKGKHKVLHVSFRFCIELECGADCSMYEFICKNGYFG